MQYHIYLRDTEERALGEFFGPLPTEGNVIEIEPEPGQKVALQVNMVIIHAGRVNTNEIPHCSHITVVCDRAGRVVSEEVAATGFKQLPVMALN